MKPVASTPHNTSKQGEKAFAKHFFRWIHYRSNRTSSLTLLLRAPVASSYHHHPTTGNAKVRVTIPLHESIVYALIAAPAVQLFKRASSTMTSIRVRRYEAEYSVRLGYTDRDR